eukprot:3935988-Rhodomonas_salina.3
MPCVRRMPLPQAAHSMPTPHALRSGRSCHWHTIPRLGEARSLSHMFEVLQTEPLLSPADSGLDGGPSDTNHSSQPTRALHAGRLSLSGGGPPGCV